MGTTNFKSGLSFLSGYSQHFGSSCDAMPHLVPSILPQQPHTLLNRQATDHPRIRPLNDHLADLRSHRQKLKDTDAAEISSTTAPIATHRLPDRLRSRHALERQLDFVSVKTCERNLFPTTATEPPHQSLRQNTQER